MSQKKREQLEYLNKTWTCRKEILEKVINLNVQVWWSSQGELKTMLKQNV